MSRAFKIAISLALFLFSCINGFAQCAMCRAAPGSNHTHGGNVADGLNSGILYLLAVPYIMIMVLAFVFFREQIFKKFKEFRLKLGW